MTKPNWRDRRAADAKALAVFVAIFLACFGWAIFSDKFLIGGDVFFYSLPLRTVAWSMIRQGVPPLWTPLVLSGYPIIAMVQLGLAYPLTWGHLFLANYRAEQIYVFAPFILAPSFVYAYAREIKRSRTAAMIVALSFTYGGLMTNTLGMNGIPTNALVWTPLLLIALERARTHTFAGCLAGAAAAYSMSVLTGHGQSFLLVGLLALAYAAFLAVCAGAETDALLVAPRAARGWISWDRWRPLAVAVGGIALAAGVSAFQMLETLRAARRSIRSSLNYGYFSQGSFTLSEAWHSFTAPLYHYIDVTTFMAPVVCALAAWALVASRRGAGTDRRIYFWTGTALVSLVLMLGANTPLHALLFHVPVLNFFRIPSRHVFEWTLAVAVLAAYGWDALVARSFNGTSRLPEVTGRRAVALTLGGTCLLLLLSLVIGMAWWHSIIGASPVPAAFAWRAELIYVAWKLGFTLAVVATLWRCWKLAPGRARNVLLACALLLAIMVEPAILIRFWWAGTAKPARRFVTPSLTTKYLQGFAPAEHRVYVRADSPDEEASAQPRIDGSNLTALYGLHNVGGYEPLLFERYSRALGNVTYEAISPRPGLPLDETLFTPESHVLDLLNTSFVVGFADPGTAPPGDVGRVPSAYRLMLSQLDAKRWQTAFTAGDVIVLRNLRAQPRAWLVAEAEAVDGEESLRRIRGESGRAFDPRRTALLEVATSELPMLPGGEIAPGATAQLTYTPNGIRIDTDAPTAALLVVSEFNFPGWEATVDNQRAPLYHTDFLLGGVPITAGRHHVEMRYTAPAVRNGALISVFTLFLIIMLAVFSARRTRRGLAV